MQVAKDFFLQSLNVKVAFYVCISVFKTSGGGNQNFMIYKDKRLV